RCTKMLQPILRAPAPKSCRGMLFDSGCRTAADEQISLAFHRIPMLPRLIGPILLALLGACCLAAEPDVTVGQLARVPATSPDKAVATFKVKAGFRIELVAAEPLVVDPIAMSFDEEGRLYVIE